MDLFEDELGDEGIVKLNVKLRVHDSFFYVLQTYFLRLDDVLFRTVETRVFHEFGSSFLVRKVTWKEDSFERIQAQGRYDDLPNPLPEDSVRLEETHKIFL